MAEIANTKIATSDPLSLCNGFALFPKVTSRAGVVVNQMGGKIFTFHDANLLLFRLSVDCSYEVIMGLCGPAYALEMELEGSTDNEAIELSIEDDEIQAGLVFGFTLGFIFNLRLDTVKLHWVYNGWKSHFQKSWSKLLDFHINFDADLFELIYWCCEEAFKNEGEETVLKKVPHISHELVASWGMYDERKGNLASNLGELEATPTLNLPIDIAPLIEPVVALNLALKAIFSRLTFGPLVGVQVPVKVNMKSVTIYDTKYSNLEFNFDTVTGTKTGTDPGYPGEINVELEHTAGFDLAFGVFANLNFAKFFNVGFSITWPLLKLFDIEPKLGPYANNLSNTIGETTVETCGECAAIFEVIFEPPGGVTV